jgi:Fe-S-cluster containining protein
MDNSAPLSWAPQRYFFDQGLRFECTQCGHCCTGDPGIVYVAPAELAPLAAALDLTPDETLQRYLLPWRDGHTVREDADGRCLFYDKGCRVYTARPTQCRTWPFWLSNLRSRTRWEQVAKACPGIGRGRLYSQEEILTILADP